jgi:hypothetical protein
MSFATIFISMSRLCERPWRLAVQDAPGTEWFLTSLDEVIALAKVFDPTSYTEDTSKQPTRTKL